ncbi:PDZ domain-containing protein [Luteolibacter arcticus]|uniref:PDZ domain-containing protein n=1 Tax=Luteolibacter arcticus TaxID=1581411 RepID=A0ABT3GD85_9BACT|nr:PDZ domain-containing protein [Luteolibacter arcticus]MCW1921260.1 PDZ domain-containing protein [Luteolibacter arcticus]
MKSHIAYGFATLLGVASSALAIEPPNAPAPIPPQVPAEEAAAPEAQVEPEPAQLQEQDPQPELQGRPPRQRVLPPADAQAAIADRAYLGVGGSQVPELLGEHLKLEPGHGVVVRSLDPTGPAAKAGLTQNDVITKVAGKPVGSHEGLRDAVSAMKPGEEIDIDYIHQGEAKTAKISLGNAPEEAGAIAGAELKPLERLMLDGMPPDQAKRIQDAIQQNLRAFEDMEDDHAAMPERMLGDAMRKRVEQMMKGMELQAAPQGGGGGINFKSSGTIRMLNADGSGVEVMSENGGKQVRVLGRGGNVEWEGPYDTPQDKEAVPKEFRDRIDNLNLDMDFKGQGLRLRMAPRFEPLEK